jgi:uncharacterized protein (DUF305 family)
MAAFLQKMQGAMKQMMHDMPLDITAATTDVKFALIMMPHHQAGINMAKALLTYAKSRLLQSLAKGMILSQQVEFDQMRNFLKQQ